MTVGAKRLPGLSILAAARRTGTPYGRLYRLVRRGRVAAEKHGNRYSLDLCSVLDALTPDTGARRGLSTMPPEAA